MLLSTHCFTHWDTRLVETVLIGSSIIKDFLIHLTGQQKEFATIRMLSGRMKRNLISKWLKGWESSLAHIAGSPEHQQSSGSVCHFSRSFVYLLVPLLKKILHFKDIARLYSEESLSILFHCSKQEPFSLPWIWPFRGITYGWGWGKARLERTVYLKLKGSIPRTDLAVEVVNFWHSGFLWESRNSVEWTANIDYGRFIENY